MAFTDGISPVKIEYDDDEDDGLYPDIPDCLPVLGSEDASEELLTPPTFYKRILDGEIILNPPYQRGVYLTVLSLRNSDWEQRSSMASSQANDAH